MNQSSVLTTQDVCSGYGTATVVRDISVDILTNEIVGIIGRNGVGKSTFVKTIIGLIRASNGKVTLFGNDITNLQPELIARKGVGYVPQGRGIFPRMTVNEHLLLGGYLQRDTQKRSRFNKLIFDLFPILHERKSQMAGSLSGGQQEMLAIGRALAGGPEVLILDEPTQGLAQSEIENLIALIRDISKSVNVLLIEHNMAVVFSLAEYVTVMNSGTIMAEGTPSEIENNYEVQDLYLGK